MRCAQASRAMQCSLDGRLASVDVIPLQRHLAACPTCRDEMSALRAMQTALRETDLVAEPDGLKDRVMRRIMAYETHRVLDASRARAWHDNVAVRRAGIASLLVAIMWTVSQLTVAQPFTHWLAVHADAALTLLLGPGPAQVAWVLWLVGGSLALALVWASRAPSTEAWREELLHRLPQLW